MAKLEISISYGDNHVSRGFDDEEYTQAEILDYVLSMLDFVAFVDDEDDDYETDEDDEDFDDDEDEY